MFFSGYRRPAEGQRILVWGITLSLEAVQFWQAMR